MLAIRSVDGLPQNSVAALAIAARGFLWAGTQDGLAYLDGRRWTTVALPTGTSSNWISALVPAPERGVFVATLGAGLFRCDLEHCSAVGDPSELPSPNLTALGRDADGVTLWVGTERGLARFSGGHFDDGGSSSAGVGDSLVHAIATEPGGALWVAAEGGLARFDGTGWRRHEPPDGWQAAPPTALVVDGPATSPALWIGRANGSIARYDDGRWLATPDLSAGLPTNPVRALLVAPAGADGELFAASEGGLHRRTATGWRRVTGESARAPLHRVWSLATSSEGGTTLLWVGTRDGGLVRMLLGGWETIDETVLPLRVPSVYAIVEAGSAERPRYLVGTESAELAIWDGARWSVRDASNSPVAGGIHALAVSGRRQERTWIGTERGLLVEEHGRWRSYTRADGLPGDDVRALAIVERGGVETVWIGTRGGLARLRRGEIEAFTPADSPLPDREVYSLAPSGDPDAGGALFVGTRNGGLARYASGRWQISTPANSPLPHAWVNDLLVTEDGRGPALWAATDGGIARLALDADAGRAEAWTLFSRRSEPALPHDVAVALATDGRGRIFFSTYRGAGWLDPVPPGTEGPRYTIRSFGRAAGLPGVEGNSRAALFDRAGRIWIGTEGGIARIRPPAGGSETTARPLVVRSVTVDGESVAFESRALDLPPAPEAVEISWALLSFLYGETATYRTRLSGLESTPSPWTSHASRRYSRLGPGDYRFEVWARDENGVEIGPTVLAFRVRPRLVESGAFRFALGAFLAMVVVLAWLGTTSAQRRRAARLEMLVAARTENLRVAKDEAERATAAKSHFVANVSHELRTPLNAIVGMTSLLSRSELDAAQSEQVAIIRASSKALLAQVSELLDFSKLEAEKVVLENVRFDLGALVASALDLVRGEAAEKGLTLTMESTDRLPWMLIGDRERLKQLLVILLSNAVKFTEHGGVSVAISGRAADDFGYLLEIAVTDTGIGIPEGAIPHLFEPFTQVDPSTARRYGGTGLGLAIASRLARRMGGAISVVSEPDVGSTFRFMVRLERVTEAGTRFVSDAVGDRPREPPSGQLAYEFDNAPLRLLVVDDNSVNLRVLELMLVKLGYEAEFVASGQEALDSARRQHYDAILLDIQMPGLDGLQVARELRGDAAFGSPYVVGISAHASADDRRLALAAGMNDYLEKPISLDQLARTLGPISVRA